MSFDASDVKFVLPDLAKQVMPEVGEKLGVVRCGCCGAAESMCG